MFQMALYHQYQPFKTPYQSDVKQSSGEIADTVCSGTNVPPHALSLSIYRYKYMTGPHHPELLICIAKSACKCSRDFTPSPIHVCVQRNVCHRKKKNEGWSCPLRFQHFWVDWGEQITAREEQSSGKQSRMRADTQTWGWITAGETNTSLFGVRTHSFMRNLSRRH